MPISTNINSAAALYALMTTSDPIDLAQSYTQTANIDMTTFGFPSESIAHNVGLTPYSFLGIYDGGGYTITIGAVVSGYTGLFDSLAKALIAESAIVKNINVIYQNPINNTLSVNAWGGLVGEMAVCSIQNCSVTINAPLSVTINQIDSNIGAICGFMGQNSSITNTRLIINNTVQLQGSNDSDVGLICGQNSNSSITNCSITTASTAFNISVMTGQSINSVAGLICGGVYDSLTALNTALLENITVNLNNNGSITIDNISGATPPTPLGAFCGIIDGTPTGISVRNCTININNNQALIGPFDDFFGIGRAIFAEGCQFNYSMLYGNSSRNITINPPPPINTPLIYTLSFTDLYSLLSSNIPYYIPFDYADITLDSQIIGLRNFSQIPAGITINGTLQPVGTVFSSSSPGYTYTINVKGVGSMYFQFNYSQILPIISNTTEECICQMPICSTNPQTGISANSRITNIREDKTIRINVDREFADKSVIYPKFKSYSDYMKYLQAALKY